MQSQQDLSSRLLGAQQETTTGHDEQQYSEPVERKTSQPKSILFSKLTTNAFGNIGGQGQTEPQETTTPVQREISISPSKWQSFKLFFINIYEITLICLGLAASIYMNDVISFVYQILMQVLLYFSMKKMGHHVPLQKKISQVSLIIITMILVTKWIIMDYYDNDILANSENTSTLLTFGFSFKTIKDTGVVTFNTWLSVKFELIAVALNLLLVHYYTVQQQRIQFKQPLGYVHHSQWLGQYMILYYAFFFFLAIDTFFAQTIIQFTVLAFMILIMYLWAYNYSHKNQVIRFVVVWSQRLYTLQLAFLALTQITPISNELKDTPLLYDAFFIAGLILKKEPYYASITHIFIMCAVLGFGQLYETCYQNYLQEQHEKGDAYRQAGLKQYTQGLLQKQVEIQNQVKKMSFLVASAGLGRQTTNLSNQTALMKKAAQKEKSLFGFKDIKQFNYKEFVEKYAPYVYIWVCRVCCLVLAYYYHGYQGLVLLTWILLSFMITLVTFVYYTVIIITPLMTLIFMFLYFINIPGLFLNKAGELDGNEELYQYGLIFKNAPLEMGFMIFTLTFFILLIPTRYILKLQRDDFRHSLFKKLSNKQSNFLYQLMFYILKRLHVFALLIIFVTQMKELTIYYVGLMFFFIMFASSLNTYRKKGRMLVGYAAFFIWIVYLWSLIQQYFNPSGFIFKTFLMLTFTYQSPDTTGVNKYFSYSIPVGQWLTLFLFVLLTNINYCFRRDKKIVKSAPGSKHDKKEIQEYESTADYYEAQTDYVLRKKFPITAKILNMFSFIVSEMMIIFILIAQGLILIFQPPTLFFWGFLIFSLTLQTSIVASLEISPELYQRCATQSRILKIYSMTIIILQVTYHFITDPNFLAQYGWDTLLFNNLGRITNYLELVGLKRFNGGVSPVSTFVSQIAFYIMAVVLEDYFSDRLRTMQEAQQENIQNDFSPSGRQSSPLKLDKINDNGDSDNEDEAERILYEYERIRFKISYIIYQKMSWWGVIDTITLNFYLITATTIVIFSTLWQISMFMAVYLICAVVLCIKAASALYHNGQHMTEERRELDLDQAHQLNREYMHRANKTLLQVRSRQWNYQYWLLILSMIIIYPAQTLPIFKEKLPQYSTQFDKATFWLYWSGLLVVEGPVENIAHHIPLYTILIVLILEKMAQKWQKSRFGCTIDEIIEYKTLDEKVKLIRTKQNPHQVNQTSDIPNVYPLSDFVTIGEAYQAVERIDSLYQIQTEDIVDKRIKNDLVLELKRKYTIQYRNGQKIIIEQISLLLLLLSCCYKANIISIAYLSILLLFLRIQNKTTGMLIMSYTFGIALTLEYLATLTNLTTLNNPQAFPPQYNPYPSVANSEGDFIFPWYRKFEFLRNNLEWTIFFALNIEQGAITDIWFDFINLVVLTIYFFNYGNPINSKEIKVSFSKTRSLEDNLELYAKSQMKKKALKKRNKKVIVETEGDNDSDGSEHYSQQAADDSLEYFLGATYYLQELKKKIFIYYFTRNARYVIFIGSQIFTVILIFVIALLNKSLMSLGYMIACVPLIINITDFFHLEEIHQTGKRWLHPYYICGPLMVYSFLDIALQICFQVPGQEGSQLQDWLGFHKIYEFNQPFSYEQMLIKKQRLATLNVGNLNFLILKCFGLFFIFLQSRIYQSNGFAKFARLDRRNLINLAQKEKKLAITFRFNNWKLQKIAVLQHNKKLMAEGVVKLKQRIKYFKQLILGPLEGNQGSPRQESRPNVHIHATADSSLLEQQQDNNEQTDQSLQRPSSQQRPTTPRKGVTFNPDIGKAIKYSFVQDIIEKDNKYLEKKAMLKQKKSELPAFARLYLYFKRKYVNQIMLINDLEEAQQLRKQMQSGKRTILCDLEQMMMQDINIYFLQQKIDSHHTHHARSTFKKNKKEEKKTLNLKDMEKTQRFILAKNLFISLIAVFMEAIFSNCSSIAYLFMIISQIVNAGLISIAYPFAVFGYALLEEERPPKWFWSVMIKYTLFILFMKFIFQLDMWLFIFEDQLSTIQFYNQWILFGLWRVESTFLLLLYVLPEAIVLVAIMGQCYFETLIGLHEKREIDVESIQAAKDRFLLSLQGGFNANLETIKKKNQKLAMLEEAHEIEEKEENYDQRVALFPLEISTALVAYEAGMAKDSEDRFITTEPLKKLNKEFQEDAKEYLIDRKYSFIEDKTELYAISKQLKKERKKDQEVTFVKQHFGKRDYFRRLFPLIKEQKPGHDLYAWTTFIQFIICVYILNWYTQMDTVGTQSLENSSQFSFHMVIVLFFQVAIMIIERYINRTNIRVKVKKASNKKKEGDGELESKITIKESETTARSLSLNVQQVTTADSIIQQKDAAIAISNIGQPDVTLSQTRITLQQVIKFLLQWFLLIVYHAAVFWYFPIQSNFTLYGTPICNPDSRSYSKYGCLSFHSNPTLVIFYLIICLYFTFSALQIQFGLPDFRRGSILMEKTDTRHQLSYQIFYNVPFLMELKTILDWCFTKTSLDMFQWLELVHINSELFFSKCSNQSYFQRKLGEVITKFEKYLCGCFCLGVILFFLLGPFLMFSNLSYIAKENLVTGLQSNFMIKINNNENGEVYEFPIFETTSAIYMQPIDEAYFKSEKFNVFPETKFFESSQAQVIKMKNSSETQWSLSGDYKAAFDKLIDRASNGDINIDIELIMNVNFDRPGPLTAKKANYRATKLIDINTTTDQLVLGEFNRANKLQCDTNASASQDINIPQFLSTHLRLTEQSEVQPIVNNQDLPMKDIQLTYSCGNYWSLNINEERITITTFSDLISSGFLSATSVMGFYLGVAFVVGTSLRKIVVYNSDRIFICDMPNSESLLNLCNYIYLQRLEQNLRKEEEHYFVLLECLRSPEMLKAIAGSSLRAKI